MVELVSHVSVRAGHLAAGAFSRALLGILVSNVLSCSAALNTRNICHVQNDVLVDWLLVMVASSGPWWPLH